MTNNLKNVELIYNILKNYLINKFYIFLKNITISNKKSKKRRNNKIEEELINEVINEETDQKTNTSEIIHLYVKSVKKENKNNKRIIEHWNQFAKRYEERITEKIEDRKEMGEMTRR